MNSKLDLRNNRKGLTLLEIVISISIFALVSAAISFIFSRALFVYRVSVNKNRAAQEAQVAMEWVVRDISLATCIYQADATSISLNRPNGGYVKYHLSNSTTLQRNDCISDYLLSEHIDSFNLSYYDSANQSTSSTSDIAEVEISLATTAANQKFNLYTVASPASTSAGCLWARAYGGSNSEYLYSLLQSSEGGYILGGSCRSFGAGSYDFFLIKTDANGNISWAKTYGGSSWDQLSTLQRISDGYILGGETYSFGAGSKDFFLIKTDANGNISWAKTYGGSSWDQLSTLQQTLDGGYILGRYTTSFGAGSYDFFLIKTDANGNISWAKTYGGSSWDELSYIQQTADGNYILAGFTQSFGAGNHDFLLIKTDANGNISWAKTYGGSNIDRLYIIQQTLDGGYILGGDTTSFGAGAYDFFLIKTDANGNISWAKTYGGGTLDYLRSLWQTSDGGYILGGITNSFGAGAYDFFLIKTDANGNISWAKTYGGGEFINLTTNI
jgi:prepilin-type N-terminal cleavage/methylation domain-containing protein